MVAVHSEILSLAWPVATAAGLAQPGARPAQLAEVPSYSLILD